MSKILIIENELDLTFIYIQLFSMFNHIAMVVPSGRNIKTVIEEFKPDVILSAIYLGCEDGRDICKEIKQTHSSIPFIMVSTNMNLKDEAIACGADDYIEKPFHLDYLMDKVKHWTNKKIDLSKMVSTTSTRQNETANMPSSSMIKSS